jgi:hypothetical protein
MDDLGLLTARSWVTRSNDIAELDGRVSGQLTHEGHLQQVLPASL